MPAVGRDGLDEHIEPLVIRMEERLNRKGHVTVRNDALRKDAVRNDEVRNDAVRNDAVRNDAVRNDAVRNDAVRNDAGPIGDQTTHEPPLRLEVGRNEWVLIRRHSSECNKFIIEHCKS